MNWRQVAWLLMLVFLAVGSWWIVRQPLTPAAAPSATADRPAGYYLQDAVVRQPGPDGRILYELDADRISHDVENDAAEMTAVRLDYFAPDVQPWKLTADRGEVPDRASGTIRFSGNVRIAGQPSTSGVETLIRTESLEVSTQDHVAETRERVEVTHGRHSITANGLRVDMLGEKLELESNIRGSFLP